MWRKLFSCFLIISTISQINVNGQDFGYEGSVGPNYWGQKYHHCIGKHQSPINIEEHNVEMVKLFPMNFENFDFRPEEAEIKNNGHTVIVTLNSTKMPYISGGPLLGKYQFAQLHFHWGSTDTEGSENTINNSSYPMELHMVFYQGAYGDIGDAIEHPDGLTVLSFLYSNSEEDNVNYDPFLEVLPEVEEANSTKIVGTFPTFDELLVDNRSIYFTYGGSLTTPPCSEVVTWIEFKNTIPLAHRQIDVFRQLKDEHGRNMSHNFRPTQPLYGRLIRMSVSEQDLIMHDHLKNQSQTQTINFALMFANLLLILASLSK